MLLRLINQIMEFSPEIMNIVMNQVAFSCEGDTNHDSGGHGVEASILMNQCNLDQ